jgi:hypothetical protein
LQGMTAPDDRPRIVAGMDSTAEHRHERDSISRFREVLPQVRNCAREQLSVLLLGLLRSREKKLGNVLVRIM